MQQQMRRSYLGLVLLLRTTAFVLPRPPRTAAVTVRYESVEELRVAPRMEVAAAAPATIRPDLAAAMGNEPTAGMADEAALLAKSTFPIPPDELIALAKAFTAAQLAGTAAGEGGPDWFAPNFRFVAPVVGPFDKELFVDSLKSFDLCKLFLGFSSTSSHESFSFFYFTFYTYFRKLTRC